jgi:uncharacterized Zn finger protein (UPF0148 family)
MKCPVCGKEMKIDKTDSSHNAKTGQEYVRTVYVCEMDDVWVVTEIPKE